MTLYLVVFSQFTFLLFVAFKISFIYCDIIIIHSFGCVYDMVKIFGDRSIFSNE